MLGLFGIVASEAENCVDLTKNYAFGEKRYFFHCGFKLALFCPTGNRSRSETSAWVDVKPPFSTIERGGYREILYKHVDREYVYSYKKMD